MIANSIERRIYTVSKLTADIKILLEDKFQLIWIAGEISNFRIPVSGHFYFTLKDENAQISAVMFRAQNRNLKFDPEDGMSVTGLGRISVYEPRGTYQLILEYIEPAGAGAIQVAFEQLKARLAHEGFFDEKHKKSLPFLPRKISIVTSPTGAVVHDILKVLNRRFSNLHIEIVPTKVQGDGAEKEIASALKLLNERSDTDVIILARGGGSLEDLHAFNSEDVARAIFSSTIPIISAVGHETDFSIADFVADLRAPTPSAAAEMVVPQKHDLKRRCGELSMRLITRFTRYIENLQIDIKGLTQRLIDPKKKIEDLRLRNDDLTARLLKSFTNNLSQRRERLIWRVESLLKNSPFLQVHKLNEKIELINDNLLIYIRIVLDNKRFLFKELAARLLGLSPSAILDRGYSITRTFPEGVVVRDPNAVTIGQELEVIVAKGSIFCNVKGKY
ncbi:MAG: exodeoxyribonuclease VII large subunit [Desulfobacterales bacterium]|uniref:Exodeoxyribonuclease 7 large subunit n=1 Tax=Candidatus Desulfatibia profunda TaxID=2841695 RepID=A0A8J6TH68_9BACT|nr:exodeoxyribonuclease VII large subunit [Candidatus Desulfatibia profunda]MBL7180291.1 exodeoxyribonuclease VII large subunit [Desulfobacterales bacterium]MBL7207981.1 exodeoxyribonuclease VII large subunit [Desulfobacterales bacterium]